MKQTFKEIKNGDMVYVNWPTGKGGPYEFNGKAASYTDASFIHIDGREVIVNSDWIDPVKPPIEESRLYYYWDNNQIPTYNCAVVGKNITMDWDNVEPVHRRWTELNEDEKDSVLKAIRKWESVGAGWWLSDVFSVVYELITGKEHP